MVNRTILGKSDFTCVWVDTDFKDSYTVGFTNNLTTIKAKHNVLTTTVKTGIHLFFITEGILKRIRYFKRTFTVGAIIYK